MTEYTLHVFGPKIYAAD